MKLAVFGSRTLRGDEVAGLIMDEVQKTNADTLVTAQRATGSVYSGATNGKERALNFGATFSKL